MGEGREKDGAGSQLLTKSRLVSISHPHHPSPLGGVGGQGEGKGERLDFSRIPGPPFKDQVRPLDGGGGSGFCSHGHGWGCPPCRTARPGLFLLPSHSLSPESDNNDDISEPDPAQPGAKHSTLS